MPSDKRAPAQLRAIEKKLDKMIRQLGRVENLLSDATQKLCHLIKRQSKTEGYGEE